MSKFQVGDKVMLRYPYKVAPKIMELLEEFEQPYEVTQVSGDGYVWLENTTGRIKDTTVVRVEGRPSYYAEEELKVVRGLISELDLMVDCLDDIDKHHAELYEIREDLCLRYQETTDSYHDIREDMKTELGRLREIEAELESEVRNNV